MGRKGLGRVVDEMEERMEPDRRSLILNRRTNNIKKDKKNKNNKQGQQVSHARRARLAISHYNRQRHQHRARRRAPPALHCTNLQGERFIGKAEGGRRGCPVTYCVLLNLNERTRSLITLWTSACKHVTNCYTLLLIFCLWEWLVCVTSWNRYQYERGREGSPTLQVLRPGVLITLALCVDFHFWRLMALAWARKKVAKRSSLRLGNAIAISGSRKIIFGPNSHGFQTINKPAINSKISPTCTLTGKQSIKVCPLSLLPGVTVWRIRRIYTRGVKIF